MTSLDRAAEKTPGSSDDDVEFFELDANDDALTPFVSSTAPESSSKPCDGTCGDLACKSRHHSPFLSPDNLVFSSPSPTSSSLRLPESTELLVSPRKNISSTPSRLALFRHLSDDESDNEADSPPPAIPRVLSFPKVEPSSTSSRPTPLVADTAPTTSTPSIEQEAKLSAFERVCDWGYHKWRSFRTIPGRVSSAGGSKASDTGLNVAKGLAADKLAKLLPDSKINTPLEKLRDCLFHLHEKISTSAEVEDTLRNSSITALQDFLSNQPKYFKETVDSTTGYPVVLDFAQQKQFRILLEFLQKKQRISASSIKPLYELIEKCYRSQLDIHKLKTTQPLFGIATQPSSSVAPAPSTKKNRERRLYAPPSQTFEKPIPIDPIPLIITEIDELKSLGFKIALALLILPESSMSKADQENGGHLAGLIKKANETLDPLKDSNEIFLNLLFIELDNSKLNFVQRTWKKFTCKLLAPFILFMIDHVLDQSRDVALYLIGLTPEERMNMIVKLFIEPSCRFISKLESEYISLSENTDIGTTVDEAISSKIAQLKIREPNGKDLTPKDLINGLVGSLIDRYAPSFDWPSAAAGHFEKRSTHSKSPFVAAWFMGWSYLTRGAGILFAPFSWCIHAIVRNSLKNAVVSKINSKLQDTTDSSWDFGRLALNSLYKTLYEKLLKLNRTKTSTESQNRQKKLAIEQTAFVDHSVQDDINRLVTGFLKLLYYQGSDLFDLRTKFDPSNSVEQTKVMGRDYVYGQMAQKATEGIINGLQSFLAEETFSGAICEVLLDIHRQCLRFNAKSSEKNLARLEKDFYTELQDAVKRGIEDIIDEKLDPSSIIQEEANRFVDGVKYDVEAFKMQFMALPNLTPTAMKNLEELRDKFLHDAFRRRTERAEKQTNASARVHIGTIADGFLPLRDPIYTGIDRLSKLAEKKKIIEESVKELDQLILPLEKAISSEPQAHPTDFYKQLQLTLQKIRTKTYPVSVQTLISKLQGNFDEWTTESAKQANQTHINGTIIQLLKAVRQSTAEKKLKLQKLTKQMHQSGQETEKHVIALSEWAVKLRYFPCSTEAKEISFIKEFLLRFAEEGLSPLILKQLDAFFLFLGKNHNIKGLLWYVIKSYLELPVKSPQEFKRVIDNVRLKLEASPD